MSSRLKMFYPDNDSNLYNIKDKEVSIWKETLTILNDDDEKYYLKLLSNDELIKANKFRFKKHRSGYIKARAILRILSANYLKIPPKEIQFGYSKYGKPFYKHNTKLNFNLSHSGELMLVAFAEKSKIGVDIEVIKSDIDVFGVADNFFSKKEIQDLKTVPNKDKFRAFFRCWTRKEAFIKAEGSGLSFPLDKFAVTLKKDKKAKLTNTYWDENEKNKWSLHAFSLYANYLAAVAVKGKVKKYHLYNWDELIDKNTQ